MKTEVLDYKGLSKYHAKMWNAVKKLISNSQGDPNPVGAVFWIASTNAPTGYLICDGSQISRSTYAKLFSVIGTTFGEGNGSSTFTIPDLRAKFIRGAGTNGSYTTTFGETQDASSVMSNGLVTFDTAGGYNQTIMGIGVLLPDFFTVQLSGQRPTLSGQTNYGREYRIRPYNIALTPIIKY